MIAGSDIVGQLERWWPKWQQEYQSYLTMIETRDTPNGQEAAGYFDKFDDPGVPFRRNHEAIGRNFFG